MVPPIFINSLSCIFRILKIFCKIRRPSHTNFSFWLRSVCKIIHLGYVYEFKLSCTIGSSNMAKISISLISDKTCSSTLCLTISFPNISFQSLREESKDSRSYRSWSSGYFFKSSPKNGFNFIIVSLFFSKSFENRIKLIKKSGDNWNSGGFYSSKIFQNLCNRKFGITDISSEKDAHPSNKSLEWMSNW